MMRTFFLKVFGSFIREKDSKNDIHMKEVLRKSLTVYSLQIVAAGAGFLLNIVLGRMLGASGTGIYYLCFTLVSFTALFSRFGFDNALIRYVGSYSSTREWDKLRGVYSNILAFSSILSFIMSTILFSLSGFLADYVFGDTNLTIPLRTMSLAVMTVTILFLNASTLRGLKKVGYAELFQSVLPKILAIFFFFVFIPFYVTTGASLSYVLSTIIVMLFSFRVLKVNLASCRKSAAKYSLKRLLIISISMLFITAFQLFILHTPTIVLGVLESDEEVGLFNIAERTARITNFILIGVNSIVAPKFAAMYEKGDMRGIKRLAQDSTRLMILLSTPLILLFLVFPGFVLSLFGEDFIEATGILTLMAIGQFVNVTTGSVGYILMMTGNEKILRNNLLGFAVLCILLNVVLVRHLGLIGAGISSSITLSLQNIVLMFIVRKKFGFFTLSFLEDIIKVFS
jgi:O-antigen/teichoic acid export membrane protein